MILSQKGLVLRFMFIAFYRLKEDLLRDAGDIFLYTYMNFLRIIPNQSLGRIF